MSASATASEARHGHLDPGPSRRDLPCQLDFAQAAGESDLGDHQADLVGMVSKIGEGAFRSCEAGDRNARFFENDNRLKAKEGVILHHADRTLPDNTHE
jgi:hypothetical protein